MVRRTRVFLPLTLTLLLAAALAPPAGAEVAVSFGVFFDGLAPYGAWTDHPRLGMVWSPDAAPGWRPYSDGRWAFAADEGWVWLGDEPWAWAPYHYGNWMYDPVAGWLWVPGYDEWAPAVVDWRVTDDWIGWAPRPLSASWIAGPRLLPVHYTFVERRFFAEPLLPRYIVPVGRNVEFLRVARPVRVVDVDWIERASPRRIERVRLQDLKKIERLRGRGRSELRAASRARDRVVVEPREHGRPRPKAAKAHRVDRGPKIERSPPRSAREQRATGRTRGGDRGGDRKFDRGPQRQRQHGAQRGGGGKGGGKKGGGKPPR